MKLLKHIYNTNTIPKSQISLGTYDKFTNKISSTNIINTTSSTSMPQVQPLQSDPTSLTSRVQQVHVQLV